MANHLPVVRSASLNGYIELAQALGLDAAGIEASIRARFGSLLHAAPGLKVVG